MAENRVTRPYITRECHLLPLMGPYLFKGIVVDLAIFNFQYKFENCREYESLKGCV